MNASGPAADKSVLEEQRRQAAERLRRKLAMTARRLLARGEPRKAEYLLWEILQSVPGAPTTTLLLGVSILLQGRTGDGRRIIDRAYEMKLSVRDHFAAPQRAEILHEAAAAVPDWPWPRYQLERDRWSAEGLTLEAVVEKAGGAAPLDLATLDEAALRRTEIVTAQYEDLSVAARLSACRRLDAAGFAWVFGETWVVAVRRSSFALAFHIEDRLPRPNS